MDNFDKRIKQIAKDENWEIPNEIDNNIQSTLIIIKTQNIYLVKKNLKHLGVLLV